MLRNINFIAGAVVVGLLCFMFQMADSKCDESCGAHVEQGHEAHGEAAESHEAHGNHEAHDDHGSH
ncbi:MAG: hypothetical protein R2813_08525 [Flavobacteriales bacterium]